MTEEPFVEPEADPDVLDRANEIMDEALEKAGQLLCSKPAIAEVILKQLLRCDPEHLGALQLLGLCKHRMGENAEAVELIQTALEIDPTNADNYNNLGLAYGGLNETEKAISSIEKAIELKPDQFLFKNNLALQYRVRGDYKLAVETLKEGLQQNQQPQLWLNLGGIYGEMREIEEAKKCFLKSLELDPEYPAGHVDLAFAYHLNGDWKNGFKEYEWRFWYYPQMRFYQQAYDLNKWWTEDLDLSKANGARFLIYGEQGLGDIIQFSRYAKYLKNLGAHITIHCPTNLDSVVKRIEGIDATNNRDIVNNSGDDFPEYDYHFSMMSFPHLLKIMPEEVGGKPYLKPVTEKFREYMKQEHGETFNVGIAWAGSPAHPHDKKRSIPLKHFKALQDIEGLKLFNLQMDIRARQYGVNYRNSITDKLDVNDPLIEKFQPDKDVVDFCEGCDDMKLTDLTCMIQNFEDTATILAGLDLVISCDTALVHLAGAMGIPCWVALPFNPDWRWRVQGESTVWYDSLKLYRQSERDNWEDVFKKIAGDLREVVLQNKQL